MANEKTNGNQLSISFRQKVAAIFTLLITFVMLLSVHLVTHQVKKTSLSRAEESGRVLGKIMALSMGEDIVRGNLQSINYVLKEFTRLEKIEYCLILDNHGRVISSTEEKLLGRYFSDAWSRNALVSPGLSIRRAARRNRPVYDTTVPIEIGGRRHALVRVGFTLEEELASIRSLMVYNLSLGLALILAGIFIAYAVSSTLLSPLNAILNSLESMQRGDYSQKAFVSSHDEFEQLALSFNNLSNFLQTRQENEKFISCKIWESDASLKHRHYSGKLVQAVVLHLELSKFSSFLDRHSPSEAVDTLNSFFEQTTEIIAESGGSVDKFGDGFISAVFPIVSDDRWPAFLRAAFAALSARSNLKIINFRQAELGLEELGLKIGISSGKIIVGNIGTSSRSDFSVLGSIVDQARKAAEFSARHNQYRPVATAETVRIASDFLNFSSIDSSINPGETEYFTLQGFANLSYFRERLKDSSARGTVTIINAFGLTESDEGISFLEEILHDANNSHRLEAVRAMTPLLFAGNIKALEILRSIVEKSENEQLAALAITVLGFSRNKALVEIFTSRFDHPNDRIRANAVEACIPLDFNEKRELFKKMLKDSAPRVCGNALLGLWLSDDQETLACLYGLLKADDSKKRASGAYAVYFLASSRRFRRLFPAYSEETGYVMLPIIENILKRLKAMLESPDSSERLQSLRAAGKIGFHDFGESIKEMLEDETEPEIISLGQAILKEWDYRSPS